MSWAGVVGHDAVAARLHRAVERGRLASTFLFVGPDGVGKRTFALAFARALLCETNPEEQFEPCERCDACRQVMAGTHPDLLQIRKPDDKSYLPVELFIGDRENRMRAGLCYDVSMRPMRGGRKVAVIDDADALNAEGANSLLKTLEEPPPRSVLILVGTSEQKQLPTIRSRCQTLRFSALAPATVEQLLREKGLIEEGLDPRSAAAASLGSLARARQMAEPGFADFVAAMRKTLAATDPNELKLAQQLSEFVEDAGKETAAKRNRLRWGIEAIMDGLRVELREAASLRAAACLERCDQAIGQVQSNASPVNVIEALATDLCRIRRGEIPAPWIAADS